MKKTVVSYLRDLPGLLLGTALCGIAFSLFLIPFKSSPGGVGGVAQIGYHLFGLPAGTVMLCINSPLFIVGLIFFGKNFGLKTITAILSLSFFTDIFDPGFLLKHGFLRDFMFDLGNGVFALTNEPFLAVIVGSVIAGLGFGVVIKFNGSTGGTDIPALLLRKYFGLSIGTSYLLIDTFVIISIGLIFRDANLILWGLISLFISSRVCDLVLEGYSQAKGAMIISHMPDAVRSLLVELGFNSGLVRSATPADTGVIYTVINRNELNRLKRELHKVDKQATVVITDIHELLKGDKIFGR